MNRYTDLDELLAHILSYLAASVEGRDNAMTTPVFATAGPSARTVAVRRWEPDGPALVFHTDKNSSKVAKLRRHPQAMWVAWDPQLGQQFQFSGPTTVHTDDDLADRLWATEPDENLGFYYKTASPGDVVDHPTSTIDRDRVGDEQARRRFAAVRTVIDEIRWLHLHPDMEYRARFVRRKGEFVGHWIAP